MPKPTNSNAPGAQPTSEKGKKLNRFNEYDYDKVPGDCALSGAAFRDSITLDGAINKLPTVYQSTLRDWTVAETRRKATSKPFNSNPWTASSSTKKGKEWKIEPQVWRLISHSSSYFLAKHKGANNGFEFWHISDWPSGTPSVPSVTTGIPVPMPMAPMLTTPVLLPAVTGSTGTTGASIPLRMSGGTPVPTISTPISSGGATEEPDLGNWDDDF